MAIDPTTFLKNCCCPKQFGCYMNVLGTAEKINRQFSVTK
jgi:hypothetical protein